MTKITYTFTADCAAVELRSVTVKGGEFVRRDGKAGTPDCVKFATTVNGRKVVAIIAGKPELEAALAAHQAAELLIKATLTAIGWDKYQPIQSAAINARDAYDRAGEYGYPAKQAAAMRAADVALDNAAAQYPGAAAYALAEGYSFADNYAKSSCGRTAMAAIEGGADPISTVAKMEADWTARAAELVDNS